MLVLYIYDAIPGVSEPRNGWNMHYFLFVMTTVRYWLLPPPHWLGRRLPHNNFCRRFLAATLLFCSLARATTFNLKLASYRLLLVDGSITRAVLLAS